MLRSRLSRFEVVAVLAIAAMANAVLLSGGPVLIAAVALVVPFILLTSLETKTALYFVVLPLVGYLKIRLPDTSVQGLPEIIAATMALHLGWELLNGRVKLPMLNPIGILTVAILTSVVIQSQNPIITAVGAGIGGARVYLAPMVLFFVGLHLLKDPDRLRPVLRIIVITSLIVGAYAMKQLFFGFDPSERTFHAAQAGSRTIVERKLFSTTTAPDVFAFVAAFMVLGCITARTLRELPRLAGVGLVLNAVGCVASGLRISVLGSVVATTVLLAMQRRDPPSRAAATKGLAIGATVLIALLLLILATPTPESRNDTLFASGPFGPAIEKLALLKAGTADDNLRSRIDRLGEFVDYIGEHPFGAGPGLVGVFVLDREAQLGFQKPNLPEYILERPFIFQHDYYYIDVGVELGIVPLLLVLMLLAAGVWQGVVARRAFRDDNDARQVLAFVIAAVVLVSVHSLTNESFRTPQVAAYVWFLLAVPVVLRPLRGHSPA